MVPTSVQTRMLARNFKVSKVVSVTRRAMDDPDEEGLFRVALG